MEVEVKSRVKELKRVEKLVVSMGGVLKGEVEEVDEYFNHPCRDFAETDEALRIRNDGTLTYKGPKIDSDTKSREEVNLKIDDIGNARELLLSLGFRPVGRVVKRRKYYSLGKLTITLDRVDSLGDFVEIECIGEYEGCRESVLSLAEKLGLREFIRESYLELLLSQK